LSDFEVMKLRTGETLFVELVEADEHVVTVRHPLCIKTESRRTEYGASEAVIGSPWVPYTDQAEHRIPLAMIYYLAHLSENYKKFYGTILMKTAIHDLHEQAQDRVNEGEEEFSVMTESLFKMEETARYYADKFAIEPLDLSHLKEKIEEEKKSIKLH
jgi:hypothetical protein